MTDTNLPAIKQEQEIIQAFDQGSPMQRLLGATLERLGGVDFMQEWAEDNPSEFVQVLMAANPAAAPGGNGNTLNLNLHPALAAGPLDQGRTFDND